MKYTLSVLVENHPGVLSKVSGLFSRRGFNIDSLAVGITEDSNISRIKEMGYTLRLKSCLWHGFRKFLVIVNV